MQGAARPSSPAQADSLSPVQAALVFGFYAALEQTMACAYYGSLTRHKPPFATCTFYRFNRKVCKRSSGWHASQDTEPQHGLHALPCVSYDCTAHGCSHS